MNCRFCFGTATSSLSTAITILSNVAGHTLRKSGFCQQMTKRFQDSGAVANPLMKGDILNLLWQVPLDFGTVLVHTSGNPQRFKGLSLELIFNRATRKMETYTILYW